VERDATEINLKQNTELSMDVQATNVAISGFSSTASPFALAAGLGETSPDDTARQLERSQEEALKAQAVALDAADMDRLVAGHDSALNDLMERHGERLFHYLVRALENEEDAADVAQETFARVYEHRSSYNVTHKFSTWLYAIASNLVRNRYRWRVRHPQVALESLLEATGGDHCQLLTHNGGNPEQNLEDTELAEAVRCAVAQLPDDLRRNAGVSRAKAIAGESLANARCSSSLIAAFF
jgi:RNA polymerase sigma-70 factor (ECF subfamily)